MNIVQTPVDEMKIGMTLAHRGARGTIKPVKVKEIVPSRRHNWYRVNNSFIYHNGGFFEQILQDAEVL